MVIKEITVKDIMTKTNLPVSDFAVNPYVGCTHACKYCYASFMKRFTNHPEPWGEFIDVKNWTPIRDRGQLAGKEAFFCSVTDPYQPHEARFKRTRAKHGELPVVVNYFYHETITKSAQKQAVTASAWQTHDGQQPD